MQHAGLGSWFGTVFAASVLLGAVTCSPACAQVGGEVRGRDARETAGAPDPTPHLVIGDPRFKHWDSARVVGFSPDGETLVSTSTDGTARFWDVASGQSRQLTFERPTGAALTAAGRVLLLTDVGAVKQVDIVTGREMGRIEVPLPEFRYVVSTPDGNRLAILTTDGTAVVWDVAANRAIQTLQQQGVRWNALAISPDGRWLAAGHENGALVFEVAGGARKHEFVHRDNAGNGLSVFGLAFSPDNRLLAAGDADGTVRIYSIATGEVDQELDLRTSVSKIVWSRDGHLLAAAGNSGVLLWQMNERRQRWLREFRAHSIAFSRDDKHLAISTGHTVLVLDAATGHNSDVVGERPAADHLSLCFHPDGRLLTGCDAGNVHVWNVEDESQLDVWHADDAPTVRLAASGDGKLVASVGANGMIRLWDMATKGERYTFYGTGGDALPSIAFSPDNQTFAWRPLKRSIEVVDLRNPGQIVSLMAPRVSLRGRMMFAPDGRRLVAAGSVNTVTVWDVQKQAVEHLLGGKTSQDQNPVA
ncbi:MAG TPA: WD40 repeat domain-containing protein, partial [Planctomycetaceae bacterium]|nr:WD40 repeat domain-containing protein [Planctomycetaceae bacterium]